MTSVAILDDYQDVALGFPAWKQLPAGAEVVAFRDHLTSEDELVDRLARFDVVVGMRERTPFPRSLLQRLPNLRLLVTTGGGNAVFDIGAAAELGITVCGTGGVGWTTAELTWGLILDLVHKIRVEDAAVRAGRWQTTLGWGVHGRTLGLLGLGRLGSLVAGYGKAFDMDVIAWSQNLTAEKAAAAGATLVTKDELLARADIVSIHLVLSSRTRGLVGARELSLMKPKSYLVNTSRGPIVDEPALIDALERKAIAGAGLDTFEVEPLPLDHPFRRLENVLVTPHIGYVTEECYDVFFNDVAEDIARWLEGNPIRVIKPR